MKHSTISIASACLSHLRTERPYVVGDEDRDEPRRPYRTNEGKRRNAARTARYLKRVSTRCTRRAEQAMLRGLLGELATSPLVELPAASSLPTDPIPPEREPYLPASDQRGDWHPYDIHLLVASESPEFLVQHDRQPTGLDSSGEVCDWQEMVVNSLSNPGEPAPYIDRWATGVAECRALTPDLD